MKAIRFLPLVFLVGIDGFAMFAPYALLVMMIAYAAGAAACNRREFRLLLATESRDRGLARTRQRSSCWPGGRSNAFQAPA